MSNFDLRKFLAEGKLYKENLADTRMEAERNARIFHKDLVTKYGFDAVADALEAAFDNAEEGGMGYENIADTFKMDNSILIDMIEDTLSEAMSKPTKMKMSELKKKIREEILSELALNEDDNIDFDGGAETEGPNGENVSPVAEATKDGDGEVPSKDADTDIDIEDKEEVEVDVEEKPKMSTTDSEFLDELEALKKQADAMGDNKLERQIDNTITYFTRQHIAKDTNESIELEEADKDYYDDAERDDAAHIAALEKDMEDDKRSAMKESLEILKMKKLAGLITEGEYAKALLRENIEQDIVTAAKPKIKDLMSEPRTEMIDGVLHIDFDDIGTLWSEVFEEVFKREMDDLIDQDVDDFEKVQNIVMDMITNNGEIEFEFDY